MLEKIKQHMAVLVQRIVKNPDRPLPPTLDYVRLVLSAIHPALWRRYQNRVQARRVRRARKGYARTHERIRARLRSGGKLRVLFIVQSTSKWKCQSLYDDLKMDDRFDVLIGVSMPAGSWYSTPRERAAAQEKVRAFFAERGCSIINVYDPWKDRYANLKTLAPDIVFYPESYYQPPRHRPDNIASFALTYYVPYYAQDYGALETNCLLPIFQLYYRYIIQNEEWASIFKTELAKVGHDLAGDIVGLGHPMLDLIHFAPDAFDTAERLTIIYAPHWTVEVPGQVDLFKYATFRENGHEILAYAQQHPEFKWVFRPHPNLKGQLKRCDFMTPDEVDAYYAEWASLGIYSTGGGYERLFDEAHVMITDCGSFLTEFGATGKPLLHLISARNPLIPLPPSKRVFDTFYQIRELSELESTLATVLERREDPLRARRVAALTAGKLVGNNAGKAIHQALVSELLKYPDLHLSPDK